MTSEAKTLAAASGSARLIKRRDAAWAKYHAAVKAWEKARERMAGLQWKAEDLSAKCEQLGLPNTEGGRAL